MSFSDESKDNKIYFAVAIFIIIVVVLTIFLSSNQLISAKINDTVLNNSWIEDISERDSGSGFLGLEKWASFTYKNNDESYPAYITVTTFKTIFLMNEQTLKNKMEETIKESFGPDVSIDLESKTTGERTLGNGHSTLYSIYDGNYSFNENNEKIKIIGETWNCGVSGTSIICIGYAQITDNTNNNSEPSLNNWIKILKDIDGTFGEDFKGVGGLIYNTKCH